jgi:hypothetical protein
MALHPPCTADRCFGQLALGVVFLSAGLFLGAWAMFALRVIQLDWRLAVVSSAPHPVDWHL